MSTTAEAIRPSYRSTRRDSSKQAERPEAGGVNTSVITVQSDDPFQLLSLPSFGPELTPQAKASPFARDSIKPNTKVQTFNGPDLQFSDPLLQSPTLSSQYVRKEEFVQAKRSARGAWLTVAVLGAFIVGGAYWVTERVTADGSTIDSLTTKVADLSKQIDTELGVVSARNAEVRQLKEQISTERSKAARLR